MTEQATGWIDRNMGRVAILLVVGTCLCFAGLGYLQVQVRSQASKGAKARERQQRVYPVSVKVYEDAAARGVITASDLTCFKSGRRCPKPTRTPSP